jgi:hypothetical protein
MTEIKPTYATFEQAKLLKEKEFNSHVTHYYFEDGEFKEHSLKGTNGYYGEEYEFNLSEFNENWNDKWLTKKSGNRCFGCSKDRGYFETYSAPEQWQVVEWLLNKYSIDVSVYGELPYLFHPGDENGDGELQWHFEYRIIQKKNSQKCEVVEPKNWFNSKQEAYSAAFDYIIETRLI